MSCVCWRGLRRCSVKALDVRKEHGRYYFKLGGARDPAEFADTVQRLKAAVPFPEREWNPETLEWSIPVAYEEALYPILDNFRSCCDLLRMQLWLF